MREIKDYEECLNEIMDSTAHYLMTNKIKNLVLGLSGGLDSTITAAIVDIMKTKYPELELHLIGISLPTVTNEPDEQDGARKCAVFCDEYYEHNINQEYEDFAIEAFGIAGDETPTSLGNIKARIRMMHLYNMAGVRKGIVLDTDNLTEHHLGFFTIHGDVGDLNIIGDLWKSELYKLAKYIRDVYFENHLLKKEALDNAIWIVPTDGNGVKAGGDMAQIAPGCTYEEVDKILDGWIHGNRTVSQFIEWCKQFVPSVSKDNIIKIVERNKNSAFKRNKLPVKIGIPQYIFTE